ncbi:hypothetical protein MTO96_041659, partial [Rhipicephalus appendiculatus]
ARNARNATRKRRKRAKKLKLSCQLVDDAALCTIGKNRTKCNKEETRACDKLGKRCDFSTGAALCIGLGDKQDTKCSAEQSEACSKMGKSCKLVGGKPLCV